MKVAKRGRKCPSDNNDIITLEDGLENAELTPLEQELLDEECGGPANSEDSAETATSSTVSDDVDEAK